MKTFLLFALSLGPAFAFGVTPGGFGEFQCPLGLGKPQPQELYMLQIEPIFFSMEKTPSCLQWLEKLGVVRDKMLELHHLATDDLGSSGVESRKAAEALSQIIAGILLDSKAVLGKGELCDGTKLDIKAQEALKHVVRSLVASNAQLELAIRTSGKMLSLSKDIEKVFADTKRLIQAEIDLRDSWFKRRGCEALQKEYDRLCRVPEAPAPNQTGAIQLRSFDQISARPPVEAPKPPAQIDFLHSQLFSRTASQQATMRAMIGQRTTFEKLTHPLKSLGFRKDEQPDRRDFWSIEETFYRGVAPSLQLCGLRKALASYTKTLSTEEDICDRFNCGPNGNSLFESIDRPHAPGKNPFCAFYANYRAVEAQYLAAYRTYQESLARNPKGKVSTGSFCPVTMDYAETATPHGGFNTPVREGQQNQEHYEPR